MSKPKLSGEERDLLRSAEAEEFDSVLTDRRRAELEQLAGNTFRKDKRNNIRISRSHPFSVRE